MKQHKKILFLLALLLGLLTSFPVVAAEGMSVTRSDGKTEAVYMYRFDDDTYVKNQWKQVWEDWYYFGEDGLTKQNTWDEIDGKWYYFDEWSRMLHDTTTPDGYYVGPDGAWVE